MTITWQKLWASRRWRGLGLLLLAAVLIAPLLSLRLNTAPVRIERTEHEATILFEGERNRLLFPGECVLVRWQVDNIQTVKLDDWSQVGSGELERCLVNTVPTLQVEFRDGSAQSYPLPIELLYQQPLMQLLLLAAVIVFALAAYNGFGVPGLLMVLIVALFGPMLRTLANLHSDFAAHNMIATVAYYQQDLNTLPPHFLYHLLTIGLSTLIPTLNMETAGYVIVLASYVICGLAAYALLRQLTGQPERTLKNDGLLAGITLAILLTGPINLFGGGTGAHTSLIPLNTFHSPTMGLLKPLAVLLFLVLIRTLQPTARPYRSIVLLALLTVLTSLAKPNYTLALIPAVILILVASFVRPLGLPRITLMAGILLPAALVLGWQYLFLYGPQAQSTVYQATESPQIAFAPLELFLKAWGVPWFRLLPELILSILFPLVVYSVYFRQARHDWPLNLAWLVFAIGAAYSYLLIERPTEGDGNLTWSAQITLLILFVVTAGFWLKQNPHLFGRERLKLDWRFSLCAVVFLAHLVSNLVALL